MDQNTRNSIQCATQAARWLLEETYREQLEGTYDMLFDGTIAGQAGSHLSDRQKVIREKLVAAVAHKRSTGLKPKEALDAYLREAAFTTLNRFVALEMLEARKLVQECVSKGEDSSGFKEFTALAPGLVAVEDKGYRLYIETLFDEIGQEIKVLFDRRDVSSLLWPDRQTLLELLGILNAPELASVWVEDETIGWVYQYFNGDEERTKMRAESQAPRNSRELAVRNQFFTPRYVVQFLTDNTLGRTWHEMMQGETKLSHLDYLVRRPNEVFLAEDESASESEVDNSELSQEKLLQQMVYVPFRAKKDPRDLRILDPACGSGHFLLYAFEILVTIYEEAWGDIGAAAFTETGTRIRADYSSIEELRRAMPELILRHNLHGVDIDPRAVQIAALALWMRAQRAYNQFNVDRAQRHSITKTNIVLAEPMPGDAELVDEFAASLKPVILGDLFKKMVEEMKLAGELGSLLKIEESIAKAVKEAEEAHREEGLFAEKIERQDFWDTADEEIIAALGSFAESAAGSAGIRRRLFIGDAGQGVAFIELMRKRFDVVLMNPPFGSPSLASKRTLYQSISSSKKDIFSAFVDRGIQLGASIGALTNRTGFFLASFEEWRLSTALGEYGITSFADLGDGVLDAMVETAAYCIVERPMKVGTFFNLTEETEKALLLSKTCQFLQQGQPSTITYLVKCEDFRKVPSAPFAYWLSDFERSFFLRFPSLNQTWGRVIRGPEVSDLYRSVRCWWEVDPERITTNNGWVWYAKGGEFKRFSHDIHLLVDYGASQTGAAPFRRPGSADDYFLPALTYTQRTSKSLSFRILPAGCLTSPKGPAVVATTPNHLLALLGILNSNVFSRLVESRVGAAAGAARSYDLDILRATPLPLPSDQFINRVQTASLAALTICRSLDIYDETNPNFIGFNHWVTTRKSISELEIEFKSRVMKGAEDIKVILNSIEKIVTEEMRIPSKDSYSNENDCDAFKINSVAERYLSYLVGLAFGRWDVRPVTTKLEKLTAVDLFARLDSFPPAQLTNGLDAHRHRELPKLSPPTDYPLLIPVDGIFVGDRGHAADLVSRLQAVFKEVFDDAQARWHEATELVSARNKNLRDWFAKDFFAYHVKHYSKSRRKAPIYWQLAIPSTSYSVWCYYHRLTRDTFFRISGDYVTPKVDHEERKLNGLRQEAEPTPSNKQRKAIDVQESFVAELRAFATEVKRIAPLWNPNLNDGVIINFAPLWRLVPQHKVWQKECKKVWGTLVKGDYDWAHLAMHLWPERVVPKCKDDRSLAITHGLEDQFWYEDDAGTWRKCQISNNRVADLINERSSTAVKAALDNLLSAPTPGGSSERRSRNRRGVT